MPQLFEALAELVTLALDEIPIAELEVDQQFTLESIADWGVALYTAGMIIEMVEFCDEVIVPCGGVHYARGYEFYDCQCERCQRLEMITFERLGQGNPTARCRSCGGDYVEQNLVPVDDGSGEYWCKLCHADVVTEKAS